MIRVALGYVIASWLAAQVADMALERSPGPGWLMPALTTLLLIGFPVALWLAWKYEATHSGADRESDVGRTIRFRDQSGQRVDRILLLIVAIVIVFMGLQRFVFSQRHHGPPGAVPVHETTPAAGAPTTPLPAEASVAVLPFTRLSNGPDDNYFADGLSEAVIDALNVVPDLLVTARTSAFHFRKRALPLAEIAARLGVANILEGTVLRAGDRLQVTARLMRARDGATLWSQAYERDTDGTFSVHVDIALGVATALNRSAGGLRERLTPLATHGIAATIALQKGIELYQRAHREPNEISLLRQANRHFEDAFALEPDRVAAYEYHSDLFAHILISHAAGQLEGDITDSDIERAPGALERDYDMAVQFAHTEAQRLNAEFGRALVLGRWRGLKSLSDEAAEVSGCDVALWLHLVGPALGEAGALLETFHRMATCDPLHVDPMVHIVASNLRLGKTGPAGAYARRGLDMVEHPFLSRHLALALAFDGQAEEAELAAANHIRADDERLLVQSMLAAIRGDAAASREYESRFLGRYGPNDRESLVLAAVRGDRAEADRLAALIDSRPFGHMVLLQAIYACLCGAPFDLQVTPVFAALLADSGFAWPPVNPYRLPLKDW